MRVILTLHRRAEVIRVSAVCYLLISSEGGENESTTEGNAVCICGIGTCRGGERAAHDREQSAGSVHRHLRDRDQLGQQLRRLRVAVRGRVWQYGSAGWCGERVIERRAVR